MKAGAGLSLASDTRVAVLEASLSAGSPLEGRPADLAVVFVTPHHAERPEDVVDAVHEAVGPRALIGCVAEAVLAGSKEVEDGPAVSVWLAALPSRVQTFHMEFVRTEAGGAFAGWRFEPNKDAGATSVHVMLCDPFSFPADHLFRHLNETTPGTVVVGGMASGGTASGETILFQDTSVHRRGAVGVQLPETVGVRTLVSQGCRPVGDPYIVTRAERNVLQELGGRPPLDRLRETVNSLPPPDRDLVSRGLHIGRVIDEYKAEHGHGDFLIRGVLGADPETGALAVGDQIAVGETVQFHVRDAATADEDLRALLEGSRRTLRGTPAGALLFTCNGRGSRLFTTPDHDAQLVTSALGAAPVAGFFCAGELGPVGGKNFIHGFTASLAVLVDRSASVG